MLTAEADWVLVPFTLAFEVAPTPLATGAVELWVFEERAGEAAEAALEEREDEAAETALKELAAEAGTAVVGEAGDAVGVVAATPPGLVLNW